MGNAVAERPNITEKVNMLVENHQKIPSTINFKKVTEKTGPFKWFKYRVSGKEMNEHLEILQKEFAEQNRRDILELEELKRIYEAISVLDDDYVQKLLTNAEAMKALSEKVVECESTNVYLSQKVAEVVEAQGVILDKFSSFDNVLLLEEKCRNQEKEIELLQGELKTMKETYELIEEEKKNIGEMKHKVDLKILLFTIFLSIIGVCVVAVVVLNMMGII